MGPSLVTQHGAGAKPPGPGNDSSPSAGRAWSKILAFGSAARPRLGLCQRLLEGVPLVPVPAAGDPSWAVSPCPAGGFAAAPQHDAPHPDPIYWGGRAPRQGAGVVDGTFLNEHEPWGGQVAAPMSPLPPALRAPVWDPAPGVPAAPQGRQHPCGTSEPSGFNRGTLLVSLLDKPPRSDSRRLWRAFLQQSGFPWQGSYQVDNNRLFSPAWLPFN